MAAMRDTYLRPTIPMLIATCFLAAPVGARYGGGAGTANDPYQIWSPEQMNAIGTEPNDWDKHFKLMADIDLGQYSAEQFNIIGYSRWPDHKPFVGVFDGNGHVISNLTWSSDGRDCVGLFGSVGDPRGFLGHWRDVTVEIRNLGLIDPNVSAGSGSYVGGLAGYMANATVAACYVQDATVSGADSVGGLIGTVNTLGVVTACRSSGLAAGEHSVGGLAGANLGRVGTSCSNATVHGTWPVGGLIGHNSGSIVDCYSRGAVSGEAAGGLAGDSLSSGSIVNCYTCGRVFGDYCGGLIASNWGAVVGSYWDSEATGQTRSTGGSGRSTVEMHATATFTGWTPGGDERIWTINEGRDYPRLYWENKPGRVLAGVRLVDLLIGSGTKDAPFLIRTADELNLIGQFPHDWDEHFRLTTDVDLSPYSGMEFNIIGVGGAPFTGVFDGDNHGITGFQYARASGDNIGLFGYISDPNAEIRSLTLLGPNVACLQGAYVGGLVGTLDDGRITGCHVQDATVSSQSDVGVLVGSNARGIISNCHTSGVVRAADMLAGGLTGYNAGTLRDCSSAGVVTGAYDVGGLTGFNGNYGSVANCRSTCSVTGEREVGGLTARNSFYGTLTNCYSTGSVTGVAYTGGLVGCNYYHSVIVNCYAAGKVDGKECTGGLVADDDHTETRVVASYWDLPATGQTTSAAGTGLTTTEMQMANTFLSTSWDFVSETANGSEDIWWIFEGSDYPRLRWERPEQ